MGSFEYWEREWTATSVRAFAVRLHTTDCSLRDTEAVLTALDVERSHQAIFQWVHRLTDSIPDPSTVQPSRVAVDETTVKIKGESWLYAE